LKEDRLGLYLSHASRADHDYHVQTLHAHHQTCHPNHHHTHLDIGSDMEFARRKRRTGLVGRPTEGNPGCECEDILEDALEPGKVDASGPGSAVLAS
jgi:hypothetical protein